MRDSWVAYKKEFNHMKKYAKQYTRMQSMHEKYLDQAEEAFIDVDSCDMHCAHNCIDAKSTVNDITKCMVNSCACNFTVDINKLLEKYAIDNKHATTH